MADLESPKAEIGSSSKILVSQSFNKINRNETIKLTVEESQCNDEEYVEKKGEPK